MAHENTPAEPAKIIQINEPLVQSQLTEVVRGTVEETLVKMHLAGVSVHRVEDISEALWGGPLQRQII